MLFTISIVMLSVIPSSGGMGSGIIGGKEAKPHSRPYMVSVQKDKKHVCGGLLIRKDYVLTAAHCADNIEYSGKGELEVLLGAHIIREEEREQQRIKVEKYIKHPFYNKNERLNDTMLLKLKSNAKLNKAVKVIALPTKDKNIKTDQLCSIAGWGKTSQDSEASCVLKEATLKIMSNSDCKTAWQMYFDINSMICTKVDGKEAFCQKEENFPANQLCSIAGKTSQKSLASSVLKEAKLKVQFNFECRNIWNKWFLSDSMICTVMGKKAFYQGDSGSPLICGKKPIGIAAYTHPDDCLNRKFPEVYMKISYFIPWIKQVIG